MAKMKAKTFVEKLIDIVENHKTLYVMACFGAPMTGANVSRYCNNDPYNKVATRTAMIKKAADQNPPVFGFDCVCLIKGVLWGWNGDPKKTYGGAVYASNGVPDVNADIMINKCSDVSEHGWDKLVVGEALGMPGHIGIYIGNGLAVECTPSWANKVQITAVANIGKKEGYNSRKWTKHGKLPWVDYSDAESIKPAVSDKKTNIEVSNSKAIVRGTEVKVINGAKTYDNKKLASFVYNNTYTVMEVAGNRVVIGKNGVVTAAMNIKDLMRV